MEIEELFIEFKKQGYRTFVGVPCSLLEELIKYTTTSSDFQYIIATSEGEAIAIATGIYLAGKKAVVISQNSGLGNMVNPVSSLAYPFKIPILMIMSWRGNPDIKDESQHELMGMITPKVLELLGVSVINFSHKNNNWKKLLQVAFESFSRGKSCCLLITDRIGNYTNLNYDANHTNRNLLPCKTISLIEGNRLTRWEALTKIISSFPQDTAFICTTGKSSRELFSIQDSNRNFYMVGSLGYASAIGLGVAMYSNKRVVIIDGDGALLMRLGNMATIGYYYPSNLCHIVLNNNAHDSTGGQKTVSETVSFAKVAEACSYATAFIVNNELEKIFNTIFQQKGPHFIQINILPGSKLGIGRPGIPLPEIALRFSKFIQADPS